MTQASVSIIQIAHERMNECEKLSAGLASIGSASDAELCSRDFLIKLICSIGLGPEDRRAWIPEAYRPFANKQVGIIQMPDQLADTLLWLRGFKIDSFVEIGTLFGWTACLITAYLKVFNPDLRAVAVDVRSLFGYYAIARRTLPLEFLIATSDDIRGERFDLCLIDADHSYEGVRRDYDNVGRFSRICMFHDINDDDSAAADPRNGVKRFWSELKSSGARTKEFVDGPFEGNVMGIGIVGEGLMKL